MRATDPVTARWASALFNVAGRQGALAEVERNLDRIAAELARPQVATFLLGSEHTSAERLAKLSGLLSDFHPLTVNLVRLLFDRRREEVLSGLADAFHQRLLEERGVVEGVVECARGLGSTELGKLSSALEARLAKDVVLTSRVNPELIAGVRVLVGSRMIDQSVQGRLEDLRKKLEAAPLPA